MLVILISSQSALIPKKEGVQMNVSHEYNGIGFVFKPTKQPNYTHEENMKYIQKFLDELKEKQK